MTKQHETTMVKNKASRLPRLPRSSEASASWAAPSSGERPAQDMKAFFEAIEIDAVDAWTLFAPRPNRRVDAVAGGDPSSVQSQVGIASVFSKRMEQVKH